MQSDLHQPQRRLFRGLLTAVFLTVWIVGNHVSLSASSAGHRDTPFVPIPEGPLDFAALLELARERNHGILAAEYNVQRAQGRLRQEHLYPNPAIEAGREDMPVSNPDEDHAMNYVALSQPVIVGKRRNEAIRVARADIDRLNHRRNAIERDVFREVDNTLLEIVYFRELVNTVAELLESADDLQQLARNDAEIARARVVVTRRELDVTRYTASLVFAVQRMQYLLDAPDMLTSQPVGELDETIRPELLSIGIVDLYATHPDVLAAEAMEKMEQYRESLARAEFVPDITVRIIGGYDERIDEAVAGVGIKIPIPLWNRNQGRIGEARAAANAAEHHRYNARTRLLQEWREASRMVNEIDTVASDYRTRIIPDAGEAWRTIRRMYLDGEATFLELLDADRDLADARMTELEYRYQLNLVHARLRNLSGTYPLIPLEPTSD